ncbi:MAG: polysaccharide biosynthesis tyrosine autokinase [Chthoniobacteraceae bacterium]
MTESTEAKLHFLDYWRVVKLRLGLILLTFFLVMVTAGVYVFFLPRQFYSQVTVEIKPDTFNRGTDVGSANATGRTDQQFLATQIQVLKKSEILNPVIEKLDLVKKLSPPGMQMPLQWVTENLSRSMIVQEQRNTTLVDIGIYHTDKQLAADVANTVAVTYRDKRIEELHKNMDQTLAEMKDELKTKEDELTQLFQDASKIRQEDSIVDPDPESSSAPLSISAQTGIISGENQVLEKRAVVDQMRNQLQRIEQLKPEELMEAIRILGITDQTVETTLPKLQEAKSEEAKFLSAGLGENHPRVKSLRAQREVYQKILTDQLESIKRSLKTRLTIEETTLKNFSENMDSTRQGQIKEKTLMARYVTKKSAYIMAKGLLLSIRQRYDQARFDNMISQVPVKIWQRAQPGLYPEKPSVILYMLVAAMLGVVAGITLAFFIEYLDTSVKTVDDIEKHLSLPVLAVIPTDIVILLKQKRDTADAEAYRILKGNIELNLPDHGSNTYTLVSGGPGEGKSTTLCNLAYIYAKGGANVLVVDADLRRPSQHRLFDVENEIGLVDYLHGRKTLEEITHPSRLDNLSIIPSGNLSMEDVGILNGPRMTELILQLKKHYDVVFFDSPPILGVSDASILVSEVDNTIMVVQYRRFPRNMLQRVKSTVNHVGGNLIGVVLNNVDIRQDDSYRYYSNYKDYYGPKRDHPDDKKKPAAAAASADNDGNQDAY